MKRGREIILRTGARDRRTDQVSNRREGMFDGKEGRFNRKSEGNEGKCGRMSNIAAPSPSPSSGSTLVTPPLKTPPKSSSLSKGGSDREIGKRSDSGMERGKGLTNKVEPSSNRRYDGADARYNKRSNSVDGRSNIENMGSNGKGGITVLGAGVLDRRTDQVSKDRREGMFDEKEGSFNRESEGNEGQYSRMSNRAYQHRWVKIPQVM